MAASVENLATLFDKPPWPHQTRGLRDVIRSIASGERSLCLSSPTGGGKTSVICAMIRHYTQLQWPVALYTNRILLTEQTMRVLRAHEIEFGVRAASFKEHLANSRSVQICSMQTELARLRRNVGGVFNAKLVIVDEAHLQSTGKSEELLRTHLQSGARLVGVTATPLGISHLYDKLIVAGYNSELRQCGALVWADVYSPWEMDTRGLRVESNGEFNYEDIKKRYGKTLYGFVLQSFRRFNPGNRHAILFAPGVAESAEFARVFTGEGVPAAHIDGENVWVDGRFYSSDVEARDEVMERFRAGDLKLLCNRYVMREGLDLPYLAHMVLATPFGSIKSYTQTCGRVLRRSPETPERVTIVDHGGNYWRHGSPNDDHNWEDLYDLPERTCSMLRTDRIRERREIEPDACPECGTVFMPGRSHRCPQCGYEMLKKFRRVLQTNADLVCVTGNAIRPHFTKLKNDTQRIWDGLYFGCLHSKKKRAVSFLQAEALFMRENGYYPPRSLNNMPLRDVDWLRNIRDVPREYLRREDRP